MSERREVAGITIDDVTTRDIDDAIWVEETATGWTVLVSIADVSSVVTPGCPEDLEAAEKATTRYFATGNNPMLPHRLSESELSLWPGRLKKTVTMEITVNRSFQTSGFAVFPSKLESQAKLSYGNIRGILQSGAHPQHGVVSLASKLAFGLLEARRRGGAFVLYDLNSGWMTTEEGFLRRLKNHEDAMGHIIIQEFMVLANAEMAKWAVENDLPVLFRNHVARAAAPDRFELMKQIDDAVHTPMMDLAVVQQRVHMLLDKADYGMRLKGHYGLNLPAYLHFTSPIRRYADLVVHRQVMARLNGRLLIYEVDEMEKIAGHINEVMLADNRARSQIEKDKAEARAGRVMASQRRIETLNPRDFERVVKVAARAGEAQEELIEAFEIRLTKDAVPPICLAVVFAEAPNSPGWNRIRQLLVHKRFAEHSEDAMSILSITSQAYGWGLPVLETGQAGPAHCPRFESVATLEPWTFDKARLKVRRTGTVKKKVEQEALVLLLAGIAGVEPPDFVNEEIPVQSSPISEGDPVSRLMEYCQGRRLAAPMFNFRMTGPNHQPTIVCECTFAGTTRTASAGRKQDAKKLAAREILRALISEASEVTRSLT